MKLKDITTEDPTTLVGLLTIAQKDSLIGQTYSADSYFNAILDNADNWVISTQEMMFCDNPEFMWVKDLELIQYVPKLSPPFPTK